MMRLNILFLLFIGMTTVQCKSDVKKSGAETKEEIKSPVEADLEGLYRFYHANPTTLDQKDENAIIEYAADKNLDAIRTQSGVYIHTLSKGKGAKVNWGDPIKVHYRGYFMDGKEFDSSISRGSPISFRVGSMVSGWNEALPYLSRGDKATFLIPSHMGYGKKGFPGYVGPDQIILFDIEVLNETK